MALGIIRKIFRKEEESREKEERKIIATFFACNQPIFEGDTYYVHLKCFRKAKKMAKKLIRSGLPNINNIMR